MNNPMISNKNTPGGRVRDPYKGASNPLRLGLFNSAALYAQTRDEAIKQKRREEEHDSHLPHLPGGGL